MGACKRIQEAQFRNSVNAFKGFGRWLGGSGHRKFVLLALAAVVLAVTIPGVTRFQLESRIDRLYIKEGSRMQDEFDFFSDKWGGLFRSAQVALDAKNDTTSILNRDGFRASLEIATPVLKKDETFFCAEVDGRSTSLPAACAAEPFKSGSLYCRCDEIAASPDAITLNVSATDSSGTDYTYALHETDLCDAPQVPSFFARSTQESIPISDERVLSSPVYQLSYAQKLAELIQANGAASNPAYPIFEAAQDSAKAACEAEFRRIVVNVTTDRIAGLEGCVALVAQTIFGPQLALASLPPGETADLSLAVGAGLIGADDATIEGAYAAGGGTANTATIAAVVNAVVPGATSFASLTGGSVLKGLLSSEFFWVGQRNYFAYAYQEVAQCVLETYLASSTTIISSVFATTLAALQASPTLPADATASTAVYADVAANAATKDIPNDVAFQTGLVLKYAATADEPFAATLTALSMGAALDAGGVAMARGEAASQAALGVDLATDAAAQAAVGGAYVAGGGSAADIAVAVPSILGAFSATVEAGKEHVPHIVKAGLTSLALEPLKVHSVGGALRALPKQWGVDRFPCTRAVVTEMFREGDFDYPYQLKLAQQVAPAVYLWYNSAFSAHDTNACLASRFTAPLLDGVYLGSFADPTIYRTANFAAFRAAEATFATQLAANATTTAAAQQAAIQYAVSGGSVKVNGSFVPLGTLAAAEQLPFFTELGSVIGLAAGTAGQLGSRVTGLAVPAIFSWGYHWRRPYGDHWTAKVQMTQPEMVAHVDAGIKLTSRPDVTVLTCIAGEAPDGTKVPSCNLLWSGTKSPYELAWGGIEYDAAGVITRVAAGRTPFNNFHPEDPGWAAAIDAKLGRTTTDSERFDWHLDFENLLIDYFQRARVAEAASGFAEGEAHAEYQPVFGVGRSTDDVVEESAELETPLLIGGYVTLLVYSMLSLSAGFRTSVHAHMLIGAWGVVTIALSTFASFGLSSWLGIRFTPVNTAVVPFLALGIGVDDMFVLAQTFANVCRHHTDIKAVLGHTLAEAGPSVTFTSITNFVAFLIASLTPIEVVRLFCFQMAISVLLNWVLLFLMFVPVLFYDARRTIDNKGEFCGIVCCEDEKRAEGDDGLLARLAGKYGRLILRTPSKVVILVVFAAFLGVMAWNGFVKHGEGLRISDVALDGSYQKDLAELVEDKFQIYPAFVVVKSDNIESLSGQNAHTSIMAAAGSNFWCVESVKPADVSWLNRFQQRSNGGQPITPAAVFYPSYGSYISASGATDVPGLSCVNTTTATRTDCFDLIDNTGDVEIEASKTTIYLRKQSSHENIVSAIKSVRDSIDGVADPYDREAANDPNFDGFIFGYTFLFWEQYLTIDEDLYFIVGIALVGVFAATFLFQFSASTSLILCLMILMVDIELFGFMRVINVDLNAFSLTNLCVAIGMAVEFTAHLAHEFLITQGDTRGDRVVSSLKVMMPPMTHGMITSVLATAFIGGSELEFLRTYYFGMFMAMIVIAYLNGMLLLPVILSLVGPSAIDVGSLDDDDNKPTRFKMNAVYDSGAPTVVAGPRAGRGKKNSMEMELVSEKFKVTSDV